MGRNLAAAVIASVAAMQGLASAAGPRVEHFAALPAAEFAAISPDGRVLALVQGTGGDDRAVSFFPLDGAKPIRVTIGPLKARALQWASNDRVLLTVSVTHTFKRFYTYEFFRLLTINFRTGENHYLFGKDSEFDFTTGTPGVLHLLPDEPETILAELGHVYRVNLETDKREKVEEREYSTEYFIADAKANLRLRIDYRDELQPKHEVMHRPPGEKWFKKIGEYEHKHDDDDPFYVFAMNEGGDKALAIGRGENGRQQLFEYDLTGNLGKSLWRDEQFDLGAAIFDPYRRTVTGVEYVTDLPTQKYFDADLAEVLSLVKRALGAFDAVGIESYSLDRQMLLIRASKAGAPAEVFLFDRKKKELSLVASNYPAIRPDMLGAVERFDYTARDGLNIPGYLFVPPGKERKQMALVVLPHGGPGARDSMSFDWEAQYYAALGFAVYKPNFRGSTGYGVEFRDAGDREWGGKMQDDITQGVEALVARGLVDPDRICIVGASYGGYAALVGGGKTPDLYRCVAATGGVTDLMELFEFAEKYAGRSSDFVKGMRRTIGAGWRDREKMRAISPVFMADNIKAPVLLIHGKDDTVVPIDQSRAMAAALRSAGKDVSLVELEGEDHWLSMASTRKRMLEETGAFLLKHLAQ